VNLAALLFDVARRQPEAPAVSDGFHAWSYREFARRISCLAAGLAGSGLQPGDRVILCMENCAEFLELMFACWTAGLCAVLVVKPQQLRIPARPGDRQLIIGQDVRPLLRLAPARSDHHGDFGDAELPGGEYPRRGPQSGHRPRPPAPASSNPTP
jgi:non-ribosomal peptide synthetase component F